MRVTTFLREISRNLTSGTARVGVLTGLAAALLTALILLEVLTIAGFVKQGVDYRAGGASITTLALTGRIDGQACEELSAVPDVIASGAMREEVATVLDVLPASPIKHYTSTPSFARVLGAGDSGEGLYFSDAVVEAVGTGAIAVDGREIPVRGTYNYPSDGRRAGFGWATLVPTYATDGVFDECWVQVWPERGDTRQLLLSTLTPPKDAKSSDEPKVSQLNTRFGTTFEGAREYAKRPTLYAPAVALIVGLIIAAVAVRARRVEIAANLHAGTSRTVMTLQQVSEAGVWALAAAVISWGASVLVIALVIPTEMHTLALRTAAIVLASLVGSLIGSLIGTTTVRESKLWDYVKGR